MVNRFKMSNMCRWTYKRHINTTSIWNLPADPNWWRHEGEKEKLKEMFVSYRINRINDLNCKEPKHFLNSWDVNKSRHNITTSPWHHIIMSLRHHETSSQRYHVTTSKSRSQSHNFTLSTSLFFPSQISLIHTTEKKRVRNWLKCEIIWSKGRT